MAEHEVVSDQEARQGPKGIPVLVVLVVGMILAGAFVYAMMGWTTAEAPKAPAASSNPAATTLPQNPNPPPPNSTAAPPKQ